MYVGTQGELFKCTATNTWTIYYTPYTYPHPLDSGGGAVATPTFSPAGGGYTGSQSVAISTVTAGATICYRTDGGVPVESGNVCTAPSLTYSAPITVSTSKTLTALGTLSGSTDSAVATAIYYIGVAPAPGMFAGYVGKPFRFARSNSMRQAAVFAILILAGAAGLRRVRGQESLRASDHLSQPLLIHCDWHAGKLPCSLNHCIRQRRLLLYEFRPRAIGQRVSMDDSRRGSRFSNAHNQWYAENFASKFYHRRRSPND